MAESAQAITVEATQTAQDILVDSSDREKFSGASLFEEENFSKEQLDGEEVSAAPEENAEEAKEPEPEKPQVAQAPAAKAEQAEQHEDIKPPAGFAPIGALHEERAKRKQYFERVADLQNVNTQLTSQLDTLNKRISELSNGEEGDSIAEYKPLSAKEFKDLQDTDPDRAIKHLYQKQEFEQRQREKQQTETRIAAIVEDAHDIVRSVIPQVYDERSGYGNELSALAIENGMPNNYVAALTSPDTLILPPGAKTPIPLGSAAAGLVIMLHNLNTAIKNGNPEKIKAGVIEEVQKQTTAAVFKKIKQDGSGGFKSLDALPKSGESANDAYLPLTEDQISSLKGDELRAFLGG